MELLAYTRMKKGLTQRELSAKIGRNPGYISAVERGKLLPPFQIADELALILGLPVEIAFPEYTRKSLLPKWSELMYLKSLGIDISPYHVLLVL
ncbi:XRE family transcriptional regulator [Kosmotoga arenicorallina S304]|uniref:XRE family transcriptional regulator n=1 Tax=Kosmotoga arenicorallina S304 TaxID=1453497 RepID=A0A176K0Q4_9BACT|nr:helix-turn-helix transcriptional regulator [Kosmotoga arenicorallina]OAA30408.1 XRE family transcriptional regulator [Kosmotoga arenicorallina S304]